MQKEIQNILPHALANIQANGLIKQGSISKTYIAYISSLAASIRSFELLPAVFLYENDSDNADSNDAKRSALLQALYGTMHAAFPDLKLVDNKKMSEFLIAKHGDALYLDLFADRLEDSCIAMKLAIRTFKNH